MRNERTPLLWSSFDTDNGDYSTDQHAQFCMMTGVPSSAPTPDGKSHASSAVPPKSLYGRATRQLSNQRFTYYMTASLSNTMLLSQVVLGAALTALGASESSHILITIFGAMNTIIAGLVAYLKSRGQPMRARMYRDDLERVVDEIENSEVMWLGITTGVNGYDDIDTGDGKSGERGAGAVTVRSEVARLTRLYDRAVRNNTVNNPDMYMTGTVDGSYAGATLRNRAAGVGGGQTAPLPMPAPAPAPAPAPITAPAVGVNPGPAAVPAPAAAPVQQPVPDPDESPATAPPKPKEDKNTEEKKEADTKGKEKEGKDAKSDGASSDAADSKPEKKEGNAAEEPAQKEQEQQPKPQEPQPQPQPQLDPDAEPASDPNVPLKKVAGDAADGEN